MYSTTTSNQFGERRANVVCAQGFFSDLTRQTIALRPTPVLVSRDELAEFMAAHAAARRKRWAYHARYYHLRRRTAQVVCIVEARRRVTKGLTPVAPLRRRRRSA
jgi:hypothetical protein